MAESTQVPDEIQEEYYAPERKEKTGVAWLLAIGTLVLTVLLATGLFFAGRWTYRQIAGDGNGGSETPVAVENQNEPAQEEQVAQGNDDSENGGAGGGGDDQADDVQGQQQEQQNNQDDQANDDSDDDNGEEGETLGTTGDDPSEGNGQAAGEGGGTDLPRTGPAETAAVFVSVTIFGYLLHRFGLAKSE